ncbi:MAG: pyridoxal phosphate-dependent aminotransferase [Bacteroidia bacterium]|nr:pyridoxal phosphate-dependent aminotransferase [Bacteroidia bacterium]HQV00410.1 pyridoxal phosphate-dependent aminotransferase [Bacteroidia bacterium]
MKLSQRIQELSESQTLVMAKLSRELKEQGHDIISLSLGEPDFVTPEHICNAAKLALDEGYTYYPPVAGFADLRQAIVTKFKTENQLDFKPNQIVVSAGAKQSIANIIFSLINPGDEVIIPTPYWVSYSQMVTLAGGIPVFINANIETDFKVSAEQIEAAITPRSRLFIFSSPCNPSGSIYNKAELESLAQMFAKHTHIMILSDEIYEHINFAAKHESIAQFDSVKDQTIIVNGVSKAYAMTGWRLGYMAAPVVVAQACEKIQGQFTSGTNSIAQKAAIAALQTPISLLAEMKRSFLRRRNLIIANLKDIPGILVNEPQGAFYVFPDVSAFFGKKHDGGTIQTANDLSMYLLSDAKVAVVTGEAFGNDNCIRLSYATSDHLLVDAADRIRKSLAKLS